MLEIKCEDYLESVLLTAERLGARRSLTDRLRYLANYANGPDCRFEKEGTKCALYKDSSPLSFLFDMYHGNGAGDWELWFSGGLMYHGPGAHSFAVELVADDKPHWSVHT